MSAGGVTEISPVVSHGFHTPGVGRQGAVGAMRVAKVANNTVFILGSESESS